MTTAESEEDEADLDRQRPQEDELTPLARDARDGGREAFDRLARRCLGRIRRWSLGVVGDPDEADDVVQATLLRLHRYLDSYDGSGSFEAWLYRVTRSAALDRVAARRDRDVSLDEGQRSGAVDSPDGPDGSPTDPIGGSGDGTLRRLYAEELVGLVTTFYERLPPRQRQVFDLADLQGYAPAEIAEMLEMNPSTVRANLFKARKAIRTRILREHPELEEGYGREMR